MLQQWMIRFNQQAEPAALTAYVNELGDEIREFVGLDDLVAYDGCGGYSFTGFVKAIDEAADKVKIAWNDGFGSREDWVGFERITLLLKAEAAALTAAGTEISAV